MEPGAIDQILSCETLPSLPATAIRVLEISADPECSVRELAETIRFDQGLTAKILKTVNSSFFGLRTKCATIDKALVVLGLRELRNLALGFSLVPAMESAYTSDFDPVDYWRRGIYTAVAAKIIAGKVAPQIADEAFLGGLLQDIGVMAMLQALGPSYAQLLATTADDHRKLAAAELRVFDMQHPEVGALLARKWQLPDELSVPIRFHERPTAAPNEVKEVVCCVALGNTVHQCLSYEDKADCLRRLSSQAKRLFNLDSVDCDDIVTQTAKAAKEVSRLFEVETGETVDPEALLKRAKELQDEAGDEGDESYLDRSSAAAIVQGGEMIDPISGAMTRLAFEEQLEKIFAHHREKRQPLSLVLIRIAGFETLVEEEGLEAGDVAIVDAAESLDSACDAMADVCVGRFDASTLAVLAGAPQAEFVPAIQAWHAKASSQHAMSAGICSCEGDGYEVFAKSKQVLAVAHKALTVAVSSGGGSIRSVKPGKDKKAA
ncbi:MAG: HDOD domain-containing protein [Planctomycetota bacterium]